MNTFLLLLLINYILCGLVVLDMIFFSKKKPEKIIAWTLFLIIPFLGLFIYLIVGAGLSSFQKRMIKKFELSNSEYHKNIKNQIKIIKKDHKSNIYPAKYKDLIFLNLNNSDSVFSKNNDISLH